MFGRVVIVKLYLLFRGVAGTDSLKYPEGVTPGEIIDDLAKRYPRVGKVLESGNFIVLVNGVPVPDKDLRRIKLYRDDIMELLPTVSGGIGTCY